MVSSVPTVLSALVDLAKGVLPDLAAGNLVFDGEPDADGLDEYLAIGWSAVRPAVTGVSTRLTVGNQERAESYSVACTFAVQGSGHDYAESRARINGWLTDFSTALTTDQYLGGAVRAPGYVDLANFTWFQTGTADGALVSLDFTVEVVENWTG